MPTLTTTVERRVPAGSALPPLLERVAGEPLLMANVAPPASSFVAPFGGWPAVLLAAWLAGAVALFVSRMARFHRERRAILASSVEIGRVGSIRIVSSAELVSPVAFGIVDRVIAVPADFDRDYGARERRFVLDHELAHHRSGDLIANLFAFVLVCLQWFNPLAWVAHAAFRFDQEAACDARVLDKAKADDRADYGRTIAKAASGRALLFASALDRRNRLHRRLQSMLRSSNPARRLTGRVLIGLAVAVALPATASRAIHYVDVPAAPVRAIAPAAAPLAEPVRPATVVAAAVVAQAPAPAVAPVAPVAPRAVEPVERFDEAITINDGLITINGRTKRWEELTPAGKARVRAAVEKAREGLARAHVARDRALQHAAEAVRHIDRAELQRSLAHAQASAAEAIRRLDSQSEMLRRAGQDPERLKATIRESLRSVQAIDASAIERALEAADPKTVAASLARADEGMRRAQAELDRLEERMRADPR
jgi:hypothetical protein